MSTAISTSLRTRAVGYNILPQVFNPTSNALPMRIALLGEPNTTEEATLDTTPYQLTSAQEAGERYGFGSPLYQMARILFPVNGGGVGAIPVVVYPQEYGTQTATTIDLGITGTATKTVTHSLKINGRDSIDGKRFDYTVTVGDDAASVITSIVNCVAGVLASPLSAASDTGKVVFTSKWKGLTSVGCNVEVITYGDSAGIVYATTSTSAGTGSPSITEAITAFGNEWNTIVINPYGTVTFSELETANGTPISMTGKYTPTVFKPFIALAGTTEDDKDDLVAITNAAARKDQVTNVLCPAPLSAGMPFEVAANVAVLLAVQSNDNPHLGIGGKSYPDMPTPSDGIIGDMADILNRNFCKVRGCSTVLLENGKYTIQDFVVTYAPDGDITPKFQEVRDLIVDWNIGYRWKIIVIRDIQDKTVVTNASPTRVDNTITPAQVKGLLRGMFNESAADALINDVEFSLLSSVVAINGTNPARLDITFKYKRTSVANQVSTTAAVDFSYSV